MRANYTTLYCTYCAQESRFPKREGQPTKRAAEPSSLFSILAHDQRGTRRCVYEAHRCCSPKRIPTPVLPRMGPLRFHSRPPRRDRMGIGSGSRRVVVQYWRLVCARGSSEAGRASLRGWLLAGWLAP